MQAGYAGFDKRLKYLFENATEVSAEALLSDGTPVAIITVDGSPLTIKAPSGGGSTVVVTPLLDHGEHIANISVNGVVNELYAPDGGSSVEANPATSPTVDLSSLRVGNTVYAVANPSDLDALRLSFQDGVDRIYEACVRKGSTPASHSLTDVITAIYNIGSNVNYRDVTSSLNVNMRYFGNAKEND